MVRVLIMMLFSVLVGCNNQLDSTIDKTKIQLTAEEKDFVYKHRVVTWAVEPSNPPFIYTKNNEIHGISQKYLSVISAKTGLIFKPLMVNTLEEGINAVKKGDIDLISSIRPSQHLNGLSFSSPYVYNAGVFVVRLNHQPRSPMRAGIVAGDTIKDYLIDRFPDMKVIQTEDAEEAIALLEKSLLDVAIMNEATANFFINKSIIKMRKAAADIDYPYSFAYKEDNKILGQILSKSISSISLEDKQKINKSWKNDQ